MPTSEPTPDRRPAAARRPLQRVLVIEDNDDVREMLQLFLSALGKEVLEAADGLTGRDLALRERPDLVLLDVGLPGMDGFGLARAIREADPERGIRLVAMSGYAEEQFRDRVEPGLVDKWLLKPVAPDVLRELIERG